MPKHPGSSSDRWLDRRLCDGENLVWKLALPGYGSSRPIVLGERVYLTCYSGYAVAPENSGSPDDLVLHVLCVDRHDGKVVWNNRIKPKLPEFEKVREHGYAAPTSATDGEARYVLFGKTGVLKLDLSGRQLWQAEVGSTLHSWGCGTLPVLYKNLVIVNASPAVANADLFLRGDRYLFCIARK